jgi:hypothetical protein
MVEKPGGGGSGRAAVFRVERQGVDVLAGHASAALAFDEGVDEQGEVEAEPERVDAELGVEPDRCHVEHAFE